MKNKEIKTERLLRFIKLFRKKCLFLEIWMLWFEEVNDRLNLNKIVSQSHASFPHISAPGICLTFES